MEIKVIETGIAEKIKLAYPLAGSIQSSLNWIRENNISHIGINSLQGWSKANCLDFLADNIWIEGLSVMINGCDISTVNYLENLKYLSLNGNSYKGEVDLHMKGKLRSLYAGYNLNNLVNLYDAGSLQIFELYKWPDNTLEQMKKLVNLKWLVIGKSPKLESLAGIQYLKQLERLKLFSVPNLRNIEALELISPSLNKLSFELAKKIGGFEVLDKLNHLESFFIYESAPIHSIQFLRKLKNLKYAYIGTEVLDGDIAFLEEQGIEYKKLKKYKKRKR